MARTARYLLVFLFLFLAAGYLLAATGGSISGAIADQSGAVIQGATLKLINLAQRTIYQGISDKQGLYSFPDLPVGRYDLTIEASGFAPQRKANLTVDAASAIRVDVALAVGSQSDTVTVTSETGVQVETSTTNLGEVVSGSQMTALPLNGRSYTDLLAIQPGVAPISTLLPSSVIMAGVTGGIDPSGNLNPGNLSINGQRESSNGFLVNGIDVQEHMNGGTSIIPDLDSIEQFRVLTTNFDPEYGNYNGGIVTVITKLGSNQFHGRAFEFFRNTNLDARGYFDPTRSAFNQSQFGGAIGGPIKSDKLFFFTDYQGTRTTQGVSTGNISVPTVAQRNGNFFDPKTQMNALTGNVSGPYLASLLTQKLGYAVASGEAYAAVFPNGVIPQSAWSEPANNLLQYIPSPNSGTSQFSTSAFSQTVRDDKGSVRVDLNNRLGQLSGYYFLDDYRLDNPYPGAVAGASIPGFDALTIGRAQLFSLGDTKVLGINTVNEFHVGYLRDANIIGQPKGGLGVSLASQGFASGTDSGIYVQAPQFEGVENITFPTFIMGVPITNLTQVNNTWYVSDGISRAMGSHTLKFGGQFHADEVNEHPNATFNGTFNINGTETGNPYADFLLGTPSNFTQSSGQPFYLRNRYFGLYAQDSWRARKNLTINAGLRWDVIMPWWEKFNQIQTYIPGAQSTLYPGAPSGLVVAGDPGVPKTLAPTGYKNFAPRIGLAYSPQFDRGIWSRIFGSNGQSSIRASYGLFYTAFQGLSTGIMYSVPPFGFNYLSPGPPLLATPFITAATGVNNGQRFPFPFPSHSVSASNFDTSVNWANFLPLAADPFFNHTNRAAYTSNYMLSIQRQITKNTLLTVSYVGNQGHRLLALVSVNPGNPALCLSLPGCSPFGEDSPYTNSAGQTIQGTRVGQGPSYGENTSDSSIANSNYNALEATLRYQHYGSQFLLSYTYAKSIDQGSNLGEQLNPIDPRQSRTISAWDMKHAFVGSYTLALPVTELLRKSNRLTEQWSLSGTARFTTGFPVTLFDNSDNSLLGTLGNGANNYLLDTPQHLPGTLKINTNGRNGRPAFNAALFPEENLGQLGNAKRRIFYGPGIENFDMTLQKGLRLADTKSLEFRAEAFNVFNHAQFYGPASVDGQREDPSFGQIESAATPRLIQLAAKFSF
ncbi:MULTISPECIES: carboxypeptidase regulatory-like domain-containing protein [Acidobacteriaceae]|uniref:carboxypeptidase regulatory-like domain-containing protein n=1 Tax=Acidobacteriaceae TaxID=204434 RepID=UPI0020B144BD|nr:MULTISPECIES: carboxypeptidase regulatory-like domain-containing protein [Acidobacteriaceae]MDW5264682.1 carboxypeptidase regulatory-like domain-containing protein [Edaphobacter sp.]